MGINNRKYRIHNGKVRNKYTDEYIPESEPTFIIRAKDKTALQTLKAYAELQDPKIATDIHQGAIKDFEEFAEAHPELMQLQAPAKAPAPVTSTDETEVVSEQLGDGETISSQLDLNRDPDVSE